MIDLKSVFRMARGHAEKAYNAVVFDGKSAIAAYSTDWLAGVPCPQPELREPVVVPIEAIQRHMAKSRHLIVTPDGLTNGQGMVTPFGKTAKGPMYELLLDLLPKQPMGEPVAFDLDLDALDRVQVAAARRDIRYYLNGVLFNLTTGALVGSDGHRLHVYQNRAPKAFDRALVDGVPTRGEVVVICPNEPLDFIVKSKGETARVAMWNPERAPADGQPTQQGPILITAEDAFVWVRRPIEGQFPDYQRVLPAVQDRPVWAELDPVQVADTAAAMVKVYEASGSKFLAVQVHLGDGAVIVDTVGRDRMPLAVKLHTERVDLDLTKLQRSLWAGFSAPYLQDVADCVTPAARWHFAHENTAESPLLVVDGDFSGVVMPCRLGDLTQGPKKAPEEPKKAAQVAPTAPEAAQVPETPETELPEPVPAAVAAVAAQLVQGAQKAAQKAPRKPKKAAQVAPVAA